MDEHLPIRTIAVVGAGRMGGPMALNLLRAGFAVQVYDTSAPQLEQLAHQGANVAESAQAAARAAEIVITMLPSDDALQQVVEAPGGLLEVLRPGQVLTVIATDENGSIPEGAAAPHNIPVVMAARNRDTPRKTPDTPRKTPDTPRKTPDRGFF